MTEANLNALFSALRTVLLLIGAFLVQNGIGQSGAYKEIELLASAILIIGPGAWGIYAAITNLLKAHQDGVNAALKLVAAGKALDVNGNLIAPTPTTTPPLPATRASAHQIVETYGHEIGGG